MVQRRSSATKAISLYKLHDLEELHDAFEEDHLARRDTHDVSLGGLPAVLLSGSLGNDEPTWSSDIERLVGVRPSLRSGSAGACLVWRESDGVCWALSWGSGFHFIRGSAIEHDFPPRILVRTAEGSSIKSLTKTILDYRSRIDRSTVPGGDSIAALGVEGVGEVVSRIEGKVLIPDLAHGDRSFTLRAGEALYLPLGKDADTLRADVRVLAGSERLPVRRGLEAVEQLHALRSTDSRIDQLNDSLVAALHDRDHSAITVSWPQERLQVDGAADYTKVWIPGGAKFVMNGPLDVSALFDYLEVWNADGYGIAAILDNARIKLFNDEACKPSHAVSRELPLRQWLMYEATAGPKRFCFYDARWYEMDQDYLGRIDRLVAEVFENQPLVPLDPWNDDLVDEDAYNKFLAEQRQGVVMDKKLVRTDMHRRGIEMCDVFIPGAALIHVKRADSSAQVSHLLAQGLVSADSLRRDEQARREFEERLRRLSGDADRRSDWKQVIFGLARPRPIDAASLFSFSKVNLVRQVQYLRSFAIDVAIVHIPRSEALGSDVS